MRPSLPKRQSPLIPRRCLLMFIAFGVSAGTSSVARGPNDSPIGFATSATHDPCVGIMGEIARPAVYEIRTPVALIDLLSQAGGTTQEANGTIHVFRAGRLAQPIFLATRRHSHRRPATCSWWGGATPDGALHTDVVSPPP
jgi:hypothetical protein